MTLRIAAGVDRLLVRFSNLELEKTKRKAVMNKILDEITVSSKVGSIGKLLNL